MDRIFFADTFCSILFVSKIFMGPSPCPLETSGDRASVPCGTFRDELAVHGSVVVTNLEKVPGRLRRPVYCLYHSITSVELHKRQYSSVIDILPVYLGREQQHN